MPTVVEIDVGLPVTIWRSYCVVFNLCV